MFFSVKLRQEVETPLSSEVQWRPHRGNTGLIVPTPSSSHLSTSLPRLPSDSPSALIVRGEMFRTAAASQSDLRESENQISLQVCTRPSEPPLPIQN